MVEALLQTGKLDRAQNILESVSGKPPADPGILSNLGNVYARQGQPQKAESTLQQAIQLDPEQAQSYNLLGGVKETEGDQAEAIRLYREAIRHRPDRQKGRYNLARAFVANNQYEEAEFQFKQAIAAALCLPRSITVTVYSWSQPTAALKLRINSVKRYGQIPDRP